VLYCYTLTVPAGTPENNPVKQTISLEPGVLRRIEVVFPFGTNCMVKVRIKHGEKVIVPANADAWLVGNGETVRIDMLMEYLDRPFELVVEVASPGTNYDHTIYLRFEVVSEEMAFPERRLARILEEIARRLYARRIG